MLFVFSSSTFLLLIDVRAGAGHSDHQVTLGMESMHLDQQDGRAEVHQGFLKHSCQTSLGPSASGVL